MTRCSVCGKDTQWCCSDCAIYTGENVYVCGNPVCWRKHDAVCTRPERWKKVEEPLAWSPPVRFPTHAINKVTHAVAQVVEFCRMHGYLVQFDGNDRPTVHVEVCQGQGNTWRVELSRRILLAEGLQRPQADLLAAFTRTLVAMQDERAATLIDEWIKGPLADAVQEWREKTGDFPPEGDIVERAKHKDGSVR